MGKVFAGVNSDLIGTGDEGVLLSVRILGSPVTDFDSARRGFDKVLTSVVFFQQQSIYIWEYFSENKIT